MNRDGQKISKLVIIGNGFDIAHELGTTYWELFANNKEFKKLAEDSKKILYMHDSGEETEWNDFESCIGDIVDAFRSVFSTVKIDQDKINTPMANAQLDLINNWKDFLDFCIGKDAESGVELFKTWDNDEWLKDTTLKIILLLIKEIKKVYDKPISWNESYSKFFDGDYFVINYNYTKVHEKELGKTEYYEKEKCIYIHGSIEKSTTENIDWNFESIPVDIGEIKLGVYNGKIPISTNFHYPDFECDFSEERKLELALAFSKGIGNGNIHFLKGNDVDPRDKWHEIRTISFMEVEELTILGHSLSKNDMEKFVNEIKLPNLKKFVILGKWKNTREVEIAIDNINYLLANLAITNEINVFLINNDISWGDANWKTSGKQIVI